MAKRKRAATAVAKAMAMIVDGHGDSDAFHWADPLCPPFAGRYLPCAVALTYEEWLVYTCNLMGLGLWQH